MRLHTKTKIECAAYAVLASVCLTACGAMFQAPPAASPVGSTGSTAATTPAAPAATNPAADTSMKAFEPNDGQLTFDAMKFELASVDPEKPLARQENLRIDTQAELDAFFDEIGAAKDNRPSVDFTVGQVLAFYDKGGGNGCDERQLEKLFMADGEIRHVYGSENELRPSPDKMCTMVLILPHYDLYGMAKYDTSVKDFKDYK